MSNELTTPALRAIEARVCSICRTLYPMPQPGAPPIERCPNDGAALVLARDFSESGEDPLLGLTVAGRYTVMAKLGAGSMGTVYRAKQEAINRDVALKILRGERAYDASSKARFEREARANSLLVSPHTVTIFDFGEAEDGSLFIAMELLDGEALGARIRREGRLLAHEAVRFAREALSSLAEAHRKGIIHRDIKPDNLFLAKQPSTSASGTTEICKVLDFGIAKMLNADSSVSALETQAGTVFGTPRYMSPEQAQGKPLDARSDLYSMGIIVYQMLTGVPPFEDEDAVIVMAKHIKAPPPPLKEVAPTAQVPQALEDVVNAALAKDPANRPQSAEEFIQLLDEAIANYHPDLSGVRATLPSIPPSASLPAFRRKKPSNALMAVVGFAAVLSVGLAVWFALGRSRGPEPGAAAPAVTIDLDSPAAASASAVAPAASSGEAVSVSSLPPANDEPKKKPDKKGDKPSGKGGSSKSAPAPADTSQPAPKPTSKYGRFE